MKLFGRRIAPVLAALVLACSPPPSELEEAVEPALVEIPHPDLGAMEETVRRRLEGLRAEVESSAGEPGVQARAVGALGKTYMAYVLTQAAEACFENAAALAPTDPAWPYYLGVLRRERGELEGAAGSFERAASLDPGDPAALVRLGRTRLELGRHEAAGEAFRKALALDPGSAAALHGLGRVAAAAGDFEAAVESFEQALAGLPNDSVAHHALGHALRRAGRLDEARLHLERRAERPVTFPDPRLDEVGLLAHRTALDVVLEMAADPEVASDEFLSFAVSQLGEVGGAAAEVERQLARRAGDRPAAARLHHLAGILWARGPGAVPEKTLEHLGAAIELDPGLTGARLRLGDALAAAGRYAEALEHYSRVLELEPENREALLKAATARVDLARFDEALPALRRLVELEPENGRARLRLAAALEGLGEDALPHWRSALDLELPEREQAFAWFSLGNALGRRGRLDDAVAAYRSALELEPESSGAWRNLASLLDHLGRREEAAAAWARLRELER